MKTNKILILGQVFVDIILDNNDIDQTKLRLGGVTHAARGLWSIDQDYSLAYFSPEYLNPQIEEYYKKFSCNQITKIGNITGCPNIQLIQNSKETNEQIYRNLLFEHAKINYEPDSLVKACEADDYSAILIFPGGFPLAEVLRYLSTREMKVMLDISYLEYPLDILNSYGKKIDTIFTSTSSKLFVNICKKDYDSVLNQLRPFCNKLLFKENRGGTRFFDYNINQNINIPSYTRCISHSVGVGDCFNAIYCTYSLNNYSDLMSLKYASLLASEYAATSFPDDFKNAVSAWKGIPQSDIDSLKGISLPFEERTNIHIYIAGPDFDYVNTFYIDEIENVLNYHNFSPHRPIKENGQATITCKSSDLHNLLTADLDLLHKCDILIAVLLHNDPGTLMELGIAIERGIPTIVFDPHKQSENLFLKLLPNLVTSDMDELLTFVYELGGRIRNEKQL